METENPDHEKLFELY